MAAEMSDVSSTTLALYTLGSFDFEGQHLTQFVRHCADCYLSHDFKDIRIEAVRTCSQLLNPSLTVSVKTLKDRLLVIQLCIDFVYGSFWLVSKDTSRCQP